MPTQDISPIKEKIISFVRRSGPSLPVHIAREIGQSILFTSAFLSEILSEKKLKTSNLKIGSSSLYLLPGQENQLEKFAHNLKSKEKEAFNLLKEKKVLKDSEQAPAIRVALREIRDFAIPFRKQEEGDLYWRYFNVSKESLKERTPVKTRDEISEKNEKTDEGEEKEKPKGDISSQKEKDLGIFDKTQNRSQTQKKKDKKRQKKRSTKKENNFFTKVKESLSNKSIEFLDILSFNRNEIILKVRQNGEEKILAAFNKKRLNEKDIIKAAKKAEELGNKKYIVMGTGDILKRADEFINAVRNLASIEKVE